MGTGRREATPWSPSRLIPESKPSLSGFDSVRRSKGTGAVFGRRQRLMPETESGGLCSDVLAHCRSRPGIETGPPTASLRRNLTCLSLVSSSKSIPLFDEKERASEVYIFAPRRRWEPADGKRRRGAGQPLPPWLIAVPGPALKPGRQRRACGET